MMSVQKYPPVVVVDENDNEIGSAMLAEVWQKGLYHRVVAVFVLDDRGRMLLQLRSPYVGFYPNCWDQAVGGHVDEGLNYEQTAIKETEEEVGLKDVQLEILGTQVNHIVLDDGRIVNQFECVYIAHVSHDTVLTPGVGEVTKLEWFTVHRLSTMVTEQPERFTPGFLQALRTYFPKYMKSE